MIERIHPSGYEGISAQLKSDSARSYFIRLGLMRAEVYQAVYAELDSWGGLRGLLCLRKSGVLQFYAPGEYDGANFAALIHELPFTTLISPESCCAPLAAADCFGGIKVAAWIARLDALAGGRGSEVPEALTPKDLSETDALYDRVFDHHMPLTQMQEKLAAGRGRGVVIRRQGRIAAVAQSEFEEAASALIVGVAVAPEYRRQGLAESCMRSLCAQLMAEGKTVWLQYDSPEAGRLYEKLGFQVADRVLHCWK